MATKSDDQFSAEETQERLDRALRRSFHMPPPRKKTVVSRRKKASRKPDKSA